MDGLCANIIAAIDLHFRMGSHNPYERLYLAIKLKQPQWLTSAISNAGFGQCIPSLSDLQLMGLPLSAQIISLREKSMRQEVMLSRLQIETSIATHKDKGKPVLVQELSSRLPAPRGAILGPGAPPNGNIDMNVAPMAQKLLEECKAVSIYAMSGMHRCN
jgi:hypothetical protein